MEDKYYELTIKVEGEFVDFMADFISNIYDEGIEIGDDHIIVRSEGDLSYVQEAVEHFVERLGEGFEVGFTLEEKQNIDWIAQYQNSVEPIEVGSFYVYPSWYPPHEEKINIKIDPALAFGSGHHATTFTCLEAIEQRVKTGDSVLDVGCGSGILGLAASKIGAKVDLCDTDPLSVESTKSNFELNDATYNRLWEGSAQKSEQVYDVVIANIIADVLRFIAKDLKNSTKSGGTLILSGILDTKLSLVLPSYSELKLIEQKQKEEWVTLVYRKETDE
jgi:ribosomal protein L11 methyltransferase